MPVPPRASTNPRVTPVAAVGGVTSITTSLSLVPAFSPSIENYVVRCAVGPNPTTLTVTDDRGTSTVDFDLYEDGAIVVGDRYWIRCLPHDFPKLLATVHTTFGVPTPGWYLLGNTIAASGYSGFAFVLDTNGTPVWYTRAGTVQDVESFAPNTLSFMPAATAPFGTDPDAAFLVTALDTATTTSISAGDGEATDGHELRELASGNHLLLTYPLVSGVDLTGLGTYGANETIADCKVEEIDPAGDVVWSWVASQHFDPVQESVEPTTFAVGAGQVVDVFHCNSIDVDSSDNLLVSSRHMNAVFYVEKATGHVDWKLGGTPTNKDGAAIFTIQGDGEFGFNMQHDARFEPGGHVSLFDDHGAQPGVGVSRGVEYALDFATHTATVAWEFRGSQQSKYMGSTRRYDDGEVVIGWGGAYPDPRTLTEVNASGKDVLDVAFTTRGDVSYRAVKVPFEQLDIDVLRATAGE